MQPLLLPSLKQWHSAGERADIHNVKKVKNIEGDE